MSKTDWWPKRSLESSLDVAEIYRQHGRLIWSTLHRLGVLPPDLPDVMQEVLLVIHRRLPSYDPSSRIQSWLFGICVRVVANYRRSSGRRKERPSLDLEVIDPSNPEILNSMRDEQAELLAVLDRIDPPKRAVFLMFEIEGLSCQQIAGELGIPIGTVHSRLHSARRDFAAAAERLRPRRMVPISAQPLPQSTHQSTHQTTNLAKALTRRCAP